MKNLTPPSSSPISIWYPYQVSGTYVKSIIKLHVKVTLIIEQIQVPSLHMHITDTLGKNLKFFYVHFLPKES